MDSTERTALERELQEHIARVEVLMPALREHEERATATPEPPKDLLDDIQAMKMELRGRMAAIAMGEARLGVDSY